VPLWRSGRLGLRISVCARFRERGSVGLVFLGLIAYGWFSVQWSSALHLPRTASNLTGVSHESLATIVVAGFVASIGAPVAEEVFFRGFLYRSLRNRLSVLPACLLAAIVFGLLHTQYPLAVRPILVFFGIVHACCPSAPARCCRGLPCTASSTRAVSRAPSPAATRSSRRCSRCSRSCCSSARCCEASHAAGSRVCLDRLRPAADTQPDLEKPGRLHPAGRVPRARAIWCTAWLTCALRAPGYPKRFRRRKR
jgi:hypothetical protein